MKTKKSIAIMMLLTSSVLTAFASVDIAYPAILCILGLLGLQRRFTWDIKPERRVIKSLLMLVLAIMFVLHYRYAGYLGHAGYERAAAVAWQTIARYFLASMILILFLGSPEQLPSSLGLFHIAVTISAGQVFLFNKMDVAFRLSELLSVILVVLYATCSRCPMDVPNPERMSTCCLTALRRSRRFAFILILIVAVNFGWVISSILYRNVGVLNLPAWFWGRGVSLGGTADDASLVGFSASGKLSNILLMKGDMDPTPALSITCDSGPGYLRAKVFEVYRQSEWHDWSNKQAIFPEKNNPFGMYFIGRTNLFRLDNRDASKCKYMTIRHESMFVDTMFTPLGTSFLEAPLDLLLRGDDDIVYSSKLRSGLVYRVAYAKPAYQESPTGMLNVPSQLDLRVHQLASEIFAGCKTTTEKIDSVVNHFRSKYTYLLAMDIPDGRDKLTHFLLEESSGYCEYFASGAAILLRLAGVPTRYVTGFLVTERDAESQLWVARNMDAHAWVEAWDKEHNEWTIVEATVGEDLGATSDAEMLERMHGGAGILLGQLLESLYQYGLFGVLGWLFSCGVLAYKSYGLLVGLLLLTGLPGGALWLVLSRYYKRRHSKSRALSGTARSPVFLTLHKMLARMDRKVKSAGQWRDVSETLHAFSQRLRTQDSGDGRWRRISNWYLEYANLRYRRTISSKGLEYLQQLARGLRDTL